METPLLILNLLEKKRNSLWGLAIEQKTKDEIQEITELMTKIYQGITGEEIGKTAERENLMTKREDAIKDKIEGLAANLFLKEFDALLLNKKREAYIECKMAINSPSEILKITARAQAMAM